MVSWYAIGQGIRNAAEGSWNYLIKPSGKAIRGTAVIGTRALAKLYDPSTLHGKLAWIWTASLTLGKVGGDYLHEGFENMAGNEFTVPTSLVTILGPGLIASGVAIRHHGTERRS